MKALVTGGAGFIGRHLVGGLRQSGWSVDVLDVAERAPDLDAAVDYHRGSVLDGALTDRLIAQADLVVHLAGIAEPMRYGSDPLATMDVNLLGSVDVAKRCAHYSRTLLFVSTSEIYGVNPNLPWREDSDRVLGPIGNVRWCYSSSKAAVEHYIGALRRQRGLSSTVVRLFNVYGPGLRGRVVDKFVRSALLDEPITLHGDGGQTRCFCYIDDVVDAFLRIAAAPGPMVSTYNVGVEEETSIRDLAHMVIQLAQSRSVLKVVPYSQLYDGYQDVARRRPDIGAIWRDLGWAPRTGLEDGLRRMIAAARAPGDGADAG